MMTQEQFSIIFLSILIGGAIWFRRWYHAQPRHYKVSEQVSGGKLLTVTELNPRWETAAIELRLRSREPLDAIEAFVEFIPTKGEAFKLSLQELGIDDIRLDRNETGNQFILTFEKRDLMRGIRQREIQPYRFRFVVGTEGSAPIKSHIFGFSSKYMLFRPDTGRYN
ncbi:MAG: hypothetical protein IPM52_00835 [Bacteroidetes bacterium]|nr:hypothetical protein [Bacteroidota bacterium]